MSNTQVQKKFVQIKWLKLISFAALVLLIVILDQIFGWSSQIGSVENLVSFIRVAVEEDIVGSLLMYCAITIIGSTVLALPGLLFALASGFCFGPLLGTVACVFACTIGAMISFIIGRFFLKDSVKPLAMKNVHLKRWLYDESQKNAVLVLAVTRLVPVFPYNLQNFAYGTTDISFGMYSFFTLIFIIPGTAMYTLVAAGAVDESHRWMLFGIAVFLAVIVIGIGALLKRNFISTSYAENASCEQAGSAKVVCDPHSNDNGDNVIDEPFPKTISYRLLIAEKEHYLFRNYRHSSAGTVLFPGCNFPSFYPQTTKELIALVKDREGMGVVFDCCGKPLDAVNKHARARTMALRLEQRLIKRDICELVVLCPNCFYYLRDNLSSVKVSSIYDRFSRWGLSDDPIFGKPHGRIFIPCPDKRDRKLFDGIEGCLGQHFDTYEGPCCGLGHGIAIRNAQRASDMAKRAVALAASDEVCTYCASCAGAFQRDGAITTHHVLADILQTHEIPDTAYSLPNRIKTGLFG